MSSRSVLSNRKPMMGRRGEEGVSRSPKKIVLCLGDLPQVAVIERFFQEREWKVQVAQTGHEARVMVNHSSPAVVVLASEHPTQESGWLTCWKLLHHRPKTMVIVVGSQPFDEGTRLARFIGASAYLHSTEPIQTLASVIQESNVAF